MNAKAIGAMVVMLLAGWMAGTARADFTLTGSQQLTVDASQAYGWLYDQSKASVVSGGEVSGLLAAYGSSTVNVSGGSVYALDARDSSTVTLSGGLVGGSPSIPTNPLEGLTYACTNRNFELPITEVGLGFSYMGTRRGTDSRGDYIEIVLEDRVDIAVTANTFDYDNGDGLMRVYLESTGRVVIKLLNYSCGERNCVRYHGKPLFPDEVTNPADPLYGWLGPGASKVGREVVLSSGPGMYCYDTSTVTFDGQDFILGAGLSRDGDKVLGTGVLSGKWMDGTAWTTSIFVHDAGATILLVPEPATLSLQALGGLALLRRRGRK